MSRGVRRVLFLCSALITGVLLFTAFTELPPYGTAIGGYAKLIGLAGMPERHVTNITTSVNFDYRGLDTMGEEYILFASIAALALLLRRGSDVTAQQKRAERGHLRWGRDEALAYVGRAWAAFAMLFGIYVVLHGALTPGGGFHGGTIIGSIGFSIFLIFGAKPFRSIQSDERIDIAGAVGAGMYVMVGAAGLIMGGRFLQNILPLGRTGDILSGGTISLINAGVGLEVGSAFTLLASYYLRETHADGKEGST